MHDLTLFSVPRPFGGIFYDAIQRNAIESWLEMDVEVLLLHEPGSNVADVAREMDLPAYEVEVNEHGTPMVNSIFETAYAHIDTPLACYINADIIVLGPLHRAAVQCAERFERFLMIGQRVDLDLNCERIELFHGWRDWLRADAQECGDLHSPAGIDYFCTPGNVWGQIAPFALGRAAWDNWFVARALKLAVPVVDATADVTIVHQTHPVAPDIREWPECKANYKLLHDLHDGGANVDYAPWVLQDGKIEKRN
jgi:hypothetical protein